MLYAVGILTHENTGYALEIKKTTKGSQRLDQETPRRIIQETKKTNTRH